MAAGKQRTVLIILAVTFALTLCVITGLSSLNAKRWHSSDSREHLTEAYNLFRYRTFSDDTSDDPTSVHPGCRREPIYPFMLAGVMASTAPSATTLECLLEERPECDALIGRLKLVNIALLIVMALGVYFATLELSGRQLVALSALTLACINTSLLSLVNSFRSEIVAATWLVLHGLFVVKAFKYPEKRLYTLSAGVFLALLVLSKAIFLYYLVLVAAALCLLGIKSSIRNSSRFRALTIATVLAGLCTSLWVARNYRNFEALNISQRGKGVLTIRAEYSKMSWAEYIVSFVYWTPHVGPRVARKFVNPPLYEKFIRRNKNSYYKQARAQIESTSWSSSLSVIRENWVKHLFLTVAFGYRGAFVEPIYYADLQKGWLSGSFVDLLTWITSALSLFFVPAIFVALFYAVRRRNFPLLLFLAPVLFSYVLHAFATHYLPRYSYPLIPCFIVVLVLTANGLWQRIRDNGAAAKPAAAKLSAMSNLESGVSILLASPISYTKRKLEAYATQWLNPKIKL